MWRANMSRFVKDVDWGEVAAGALGYYRWGFEPDPARVRWKIIRSERKGKNAQEITASVIGCSAYSGPSRAEWDIMLLPPAMWLTS